MILLMIASHTLMAAMVAMMIAAFSSRKIRDLEACLQEERASRAEIVRHHNRIIASYGLAEPVVGTGGNDPIAVPPIGFQVRGNVRDCRDVGAESLR